MPPSERIESSSRKPFFTRLAAWFRHCRRIGFRDVASYFLFGPIRNDYKCPGPTDAICQYLRFRNGVMDVEVFVIDQDESGTTPFRISLTSPVGEVLPATNIREEKFFYLSKVFLGHRFRVRIESTTPPGIYSFHIENEGGKTGLATSAGPHFPISPRFRHAYFKTGTGHILRISRKGEIVIDHYGLMKHIRKEALFCLELLCTPSLEGILAVFLRIAARLTKLFSRRRIWLFSDKLNNPIDSAYAAALALLSHEEFNAGKTIKPYYVSDTRYLRRHKIRIPFSTVRYRSPRHLIYALLAEVNVSSEGGYNPLIPRTAPYLDLMARQLRVWSGHGIIHHDLSATYGKDRQNFNLLALSVARERDYLTTGLWSYDEDELALTGLARWDSRKSRPRKAVYFMFTWRADLVTRIDPVTQKRFYDAQFAKSQYCRKLTELLSSAPLREAASRHGYTLHFVPHPLLIPALHYFNFPEHVEVVIPNVAGGKTYEDIYAEAALLVTDYSSVAMDMAYMGKPVIYYQFDYESFYATQGYAPSFFSWENDGFGEVFSNCEDVVCRIATHLDNGCRREEPYNARAAAFFTYHDSQNGHRTIQAIHDALTRRALT